MRLSRSHRGMTMATILPFQRSAAARHAPLLNIKTESCTGELILFTGVRYERAEQKPSPVQSRRARDLMALPE